MNILKGVNLGSWLLMEGYILGGRNISEHIFKRGFVKHNGKRSLSDFERLFRENFITENDLERISSWGANCVRVPFNYRLIEKKPYKYSKKGIQTLRRLLSWADKYNLKIILDLHASPGAQNADWHSDSSGKAFLWERESFQERAFSLWQFLAEEFKGNPAIAGFDLLNEPVVDKKKIPFLIKFYKKLISRIRESDRDRLLFVEGNLWAQEIDFLSGLLSDKVKISIHTYQPLDFTFNFRHFYRYPGIISGVKWNKSVLRRSLERYKKFSDKYSTELFVGEFGVNYRNGHFGELAWLEDVLSLFKEWGFSWTYWTYKAVSRSVFPDGIMQYLENSSWVKREGPVYGWENYIEMWPKLSKKIIASLRTENFSPAEGILEVLKNHFGD